MKRPFRGVIVTLPLLTALTLAGCGSGGADPGIATAGGPGKPSPTSSGGTLSDAERPLKFAKCMREHGVDMPDPDTGGGPQGFAMKGDRGELDEAMKACKEFAPFDGERPKLDQAQIEKMREHARCMRANGVPDFPDPGDDGMIKIGPGQGVDGEDPALKAAMEKCRQHLPALRSEAPGGGK